MLALRTNQRDVPFAILYEADPGSKNFFFAGACGVEGDDPAAPNVVKPDPSSIWPLQEALQTQRPALVENLGAKVATPDAARRMLGLKATAGV